MAIYYELCELARVNKDRIHQAFIFSSTKDNIKYFSIAIALKPVNTANFFPYIYVVKGIVETQQESKRLTIFKEALKEIANPTRYSRYKTFFHLCGC